MDLSFLGATLGHSDIKKSVSQFLLIHKHAFTWWREQVLAWVKKKKKLITD